MELQRQQLILHIVMKLHVLIETNELHLRLRLLSHILRSTVGICLFCFQVFIIGEKERRKERKKEKAGVGTFSYKEGHLWW